MNPCPQCGAIPQVTDKFCSVCRNPLAPPAFGGPPGGYAPPPQGYAPPPVGAYGAPPGPPVGLRCQMGHDIAPGASYCVHGHPIAVEAMPFAHDQYGGYGQQPGAPQHPGAGGPPGFAPPPAPAPYGAPPYDPNQGYGQPQYHDPNAQFGGFGPPPGQGYGAPQPGFGGPPPPAPGFPPAAGYGTASPSGNYPGQAPEAAPAVNLPPNALRAFLVSYQSNTQGDFWPLHGGRKTVGRANSGEQVDVPLSDATISSRHAALVLDAQGGSLLVEDTGSTNGTFVNEEHIGFNGKRELRDGDKLRFGGYTTIVKLIGRI